jgi:protein-disulfide isomerase
MDTTTEINEPDFEEILDEDDVIVIRKSTLLTIGISTITFVLGLFLGIILNSTLGWGFGDAQTAGNVQGQPQAAAVQPTALPARLDNVSVDDDPSLGPEDAPVTIVEFSDFYCGYCKRFRDETFDALFEEYGDQIRFVYRDFPVVGGVQPALAAECADDQDAFWAYHDELFVNPRDYVSAGSLIDLAVELELDEEEFTKCIGNSTHEDEVDNDLKQGQDYGVSGTPTFFINGVRLVGAQPLQAFKDIIDQELNS